MSPGLLAFLGGSGGAEGGSDAAGSATCSDQELGAACPGLLAFKDQLLEARLRLDRGSWQLSPPARRLLEALVRYRDMLLPLVSVVPRGADYIAGRCSAALALLVAEPQLGCSAAALVLEDLHLSSALAGLPALEGGGS
jgi:hypothetical protein